MFVLRVVCLVAGMACCCATRLKETADGMESPLADFFKALRVQSLDVQAAIDMCEAGKLPARAHIRMPAEARTLATVVAENVRTVSNAVAEAQRLAVMAAAPPSAPTASPSPSSPRRGPMRGSVDESIIAHVLNLLPRAPSIVSLLACMVSRHVIELGEDTDDFGARLLFLAGSRKHAKLLTALLEKRASIMHVDHADAGFTLMHGLLSNRLVTLDLTQKLLARSARAAGLDSDPLHAPANDLWMAHVGWLYHVTSLHIRACGEPFAAHAWETVHALARVFGLPTALFTTPSATAAPVLMPLKTFMSRVRPRIVTVTMHDAQVLSNAASSAMTHLILEYAYMRVVEAREGEEDAAPELTTAQVLEAITRGDRYGRTPLHVAALTGNSHALALLLRSIGRAAALEYNQSRVVAPNGARVSSLSVSVDDGASVGVKAHTRVAFGRVREALCARDVLGFTPEDIASIYGRNGSVHTLRMSWDALPRDVALPCDADARPSEVMSPPRPTRAAAYAPSGGWSDEATLPADVRDVVYTRGNDATAFANDCDVEVVDASISAHEFLHTFYARNRPVLVRGLAAHWALRASTHKQVLSDRVGALKFKVSDIPYAHNFGKASHTRSLADFVHDAFERHADGDDAARDYIFGTPVVSSDAHEDADASMHPTWASDPLAVTLTRDVPVLLPLLDSTLSVHGRYLSSLPAFKAADNDSAAAPPRAGLDVNGTLLLPHLSDTIDPLMSPRPFPKPQFYVGDVGSGAPPHVHKDAWNALMHGQKRWFLSPPDRAEYSSLTILDWLRPIGSESDGAARLQCTQNAGDVMYVPHGWGHAVLNVHASVGVAVEFTSALSIY